MREPENASCVLRRRRRVLVAEVDVGRWTQTARKFLQAVVRVRRLAEPDVANGFILDGFPRNPAQAGWLDAFLEDEFFDNAQRGKCLPIVIRIDVDYNKLLRRITGRRSCPVCGRIYNVYSQPPRVADRCDVDGSTLVTREDDREEVIRERLEAYELQTKPVAGYYARKGRLVSVDGDLPVNEVTEQIFRVIEGQRGVTAGTTDG